MKLINADKLLQETWSVEIKDMFHMTEIVDVVSAIDIKEAPEVKAIPIGWIKKYLEPYKEHFNKLSDKSKETSGAGWVIDVLESMLREWEKENDGL